MASSRVFALAAVLCLAVWIALAFVWPVPSGWVHVLFAVGVLLVVRGIVAADAERADRA